MGPGSSLQKKKSFVESPLAASPSVFTPLGQMDKRPSFAGRGVSGGSGTGGMDQAAAVAASGGGVKRGAAGSFDPSMLGGTGGSIQQGVFVARDFEQKQIAAIEKVIVQCARHYLSQLMCAVLEIDGCK